MSWPLLVFGIVLPWLLLAVGCWIGYLLIQQNGRILLHLEALDERLATLSYPAVPQPHAEPAMPSGLPVGVEAPAFELPDLAGGRKSLADFRGERLLLIFFNPRCGFCAQMAPDLATLPADGVEGRVVPLVLTTGDAAENREFFREHGIHCPVLLQEQGELAALYQAHGTPMGYFIDEEGRIASEVAVGAQALLALAGASGAMAAGSNGHQPKAHRGNRSLAESHIQRNGLPAGTAAPSFTLPRLEGGELSLEEFRGRKVLLVFSDPNCGPCSELAPRLEQAQHQAEGVQILMVSRGDPEANRAKAGELGLTFPIALQRQWEVSRSYAMFATPAGYLIDESGVIAAEVATGAVGILQLLAKAMERRCQCGELLGECGCDKKNGRASRLRRSVVSQQAPHP